MACEGQDQGPDRLPELQVRILEPTPNRAEDGEVVTLAISPAVSTCTSQGNGVILDLVRTREIERWLNRHLFHGNVLHQYERWPPAALIVSDGAYGVGGFHGDPRTPETLADWYRPHIEKWSQLATPATTLWFWNTEVGWATVHPLLVEHGWEYPWSLRSACFTGVALSSPLTTARQCPRRNGCVRSGNAPGWP